MVSVPDRTWRVSSGLLGGAALGLILSAAGCKTLGGVDISHPVMGPAPPRLETVSSTAPVRTAEATAPKEAEQVIGDYLQVGYSQDLEFPNTAVVATVNGEPILAGEILAGYKRYLELARQKGFTTDQMNLLRRKMIEQTLDPTIDQVLLAQQVRLLLPEDHAKKLDERLTKAFDTMVREMMKKKGIPSQVELERKLAAKGESLAAYEQHFRTTQLAGLYLQKERGSEVKIFGRPEILEYYQEHQQEFTHEARARFQLLEIASKENGAHQRQEGADLSLGLSLPVRDARKRLEEAQAALEAGTPFPNVVKRYSDGPRAEEGGQWDWVTPGNFANEELDEAIFSLPVGGVSDVIETDTSFMIVRVTDHEDAGVASLAEVQQKIRALLEKRYHKREHEKLSKRLRDEAVIIKHLDNDEQTTPPSKIIPAGG